MSRARALMFQGTGSDVGKSLLVAGLCRAFARRGLRVRPFKPQNMSNNAAVTADGGEIGRAQALQALACGVPPTTDMNPVLLKPQTDIGAQVVVNGRVVGTARAREYQDWKARLLPETLAAFERLRTDCDLVLIEGAGSAAEVNLRRSDIANMGFAEAADVPVVLIGDIDRGGVIAQIVGTWELLPPAERARLAGYIVNRFRGDVSLFDDGLTIITERTGLPSLGVVPFFADAHRLPAEDAVILEHRDGRNRDGRIRIIVPVLSRIANFDDFDPLAAEPEVDLHMVPPGEALPGDADLVILPGSKATIADLVFLREQGWDIDLAAHRRRGGAILGICAGFQMLGTQVADPNGIEGPAGTASGLGLLDVATELTGEKRLIAGPTGYEMHVGRTEGTDCARPMLGGEGAMSADGRIMGCYLHGLFADDAFRRSFLERFGGVASKTDYRAGVEATLDALADHLEGCLDMAMLTSLPR